VSAGLARNRKPKTEPSEQQVLKTAPGKKIDSTDLKIPAEYSQIWEKKWYPFRGKMEKWSWEEVEKYWIDPIEIGINIVSEENDRLIKEIFGKVP
ncbi:MAG: hypothetical protein AB1798_15905, partial [Spirochaetota bacterium]